MAAQELLYSAHRIYDWECGSAESDGFHLGGRRKLPIVGDVLRKYQEELARIKEQLSE